MNDPTFTDTPRFSIASSQAPKPCGPENVAAALAITESSCDISCAVVAFTIVAFTGAGVLPSPRISVVTPCDTLPASRPSPTVNAKADCP